MKICLICMEYAGSEGPDRIGWNAGYYIIHQLRENALMRQQVNKPEWTIIMQMPSRPLF